MTEPGKKSPSKFLLLSEELLITLGVFIVSLVIFILIAYRVFLLDQTGLDQQAFDFAGSLVSHSMNEFMLGITFFGSHYFLVPANLLVAGYFLLRKKSRYSIRISTIALSSLLIMSGLKLVFNRPRPLIPLLHEAQGLSFPSGHAFMSVSFYGLLMLIIAKEGRNPLMKWGTIILLGVIILLIGFSRIYLRVHYCTDVIAGFCVGASWLFISSYLLSKIKPRGVRKE